MGRNGGIAGFLNISGFIYRVFGMIYIIYAPPSSRSSCRAVCCVPGPGGGPLRTSGFSCMGCRKSNTSPATNRQLSRPFKAAFFAAASAASCTNSMPMTSFCFECHDLAYGPGAAVQVKDLFAVDTVNECEGLPDKAFPPPPHWSERKKRR